MYIIDLSYRDRCHPYEGHYGFFYRDATPTGFKRHSPKESVETYNKYREMSLNWVRFCGVPAPTSATRALGVDSCDLHS